MWDAASFVHLFSKVKFIYTLQVLSRFTSKLFQHLTAVMNYIIPQIYARSNVLLLYHKQTSTLWLLKHPTIHHLTYFINVYSFSPSPPEAIWTMTLKAKVAQIWHVWPISDSFLHKYAQIGFISKSDPGNFHIFFPSSLDHNLIRGSDCTQWLACDVTSYSAH